MMKDAVISPCGLYRYKLTRCWDQDLPGLNFIMLNPSTADASKDDATIRSCIRLARAWGCGSFCVYNLFALRATNPEALRKAEDPIGPENAMWLKTLAAYVREGLAKVIAAWGAHGTLYERDLDVCAMFRCRLEALGLNKDGTPEHPLYVKTGTVPAPYYTRCGKPVPGECRFNVQTGELCPEGYPVSRQFVTLEEADHFASAHGRSDIDKVQHLGGRHWKLVEALLSSKCVQGLPRT